MKSTPNSETRNADPLEVVLDAIADRVAERIKPPPPDPWLGVKDLEAEGWTYQTIKEAAKHGLAVCKGPKGRLMVRRSEVDRYIVSRPYKPGARKPPKPTDSLDAAHEATARALGVSR